MTIEIINVRPVIFADRIGRSYSEQTVSDHKKKFGQYLTPVVVADFMADLISHSSQEVISILDPGIGTGVLTSSVCEKAVEKYDKLKEINITGYETDKNVIPLTNKSMEYLTGWLLARNITCRYKIIDNDFVLSNSDAFQDNSLLFGNYNHEQKFDIIISNPPYFKINKSDMRSKAASKIVHGQPNMYSIFMALSSYMLSDGGDLIFITPRSYTSGYYFKAFRNMFFNEIIPWRFHLFGSRKEAFVRDEVLQEHLIIHGKKRNKANIRSIKKTVISYSNSSKDLCNPVKRKALLKDVIDVSSNNRYVFLPLSDEEEDILSFVNSWKGSLHKFNMEISTGKVVPFRATNLLHEKSGKSADYAPMIWMNHIKDNAVIWPIYDWRKEQFIEINEQSASLLVPDSNYILMRRFSPKEDLKRLNTAPFIKGSLKCSYLGLENHVNYIHRPGGELTPEEVYGLSSVFNSKYLDIYFRTLNGNTEVSATEIRDIPLPEHDVICEIGSEIITKGNFDIDVESILDLTKAGAA